MFNETETLLKAAQALGIDPELAKGVNTRLADLIAEALIHARENGDNVPIDAIMKEAPQLLRMPSFVRALLNCGVGTRLMPEYSEPSEDAPVVATVTIRFRTQKDADYFFANSFDYADDGEVLSVEYEPE